MASRLEAVSLSKEIVFDSMKAIRRLPRHVYHLAEAANWPSIQRLGLLPAEALIARSGIRGRMRECLRAEQRKGHLILSEGCQIRDQRPMPAEALSTCLIGMAAGDWYRLVNSHVYFWLDPARLNRQRAACGGRPQLVLVVDAAALVEQYKRRATLTPINTGNARRRPAVRGVATFVPYETWLARGWASEAAALKRTVRSLSHRPVELAIAGSVPDFARYLVRVVKLTANKSFIPT